MSNEKTFRLAHLLAQRGIASRRASEEIVREGRVRVDGEIVVDPAFQVEAGNEQIEVDGKPLPKPKPHLYLALNKPPGYLSSFTKANEPGALLSELVKKERRLFTVGRLDLNSRGLLLLTTDGDWANLVMHPRYEKEKEYQVRFRKVSPKEAEAKMKLASYVEKGRTFRAKRIQRQGQYISIVLREGRNRQIRQLATAQQLWIGDLVRTRIGSVSLGSLREGHWRNLSEQEVKELAETGSPGKRKK